MKSMILSLAALVLVTSNFQAQLEGASAPFSGSEMSCKQPERGPTGPTGPQGPQGPTGTNGTNGTNGSFNFIYTETDSGGDLTSVPVNGTIIFSTTYVETSGTSISFVGPSDTFTLNDAAWYEAQVVAYADSPADVGLQFYLAGSPIAPAKTVTNTGVTTIAVDKIIESAAGQALTVRVINTTTGTEMNFAPGTEISIRIVKLADAPPPT